MGYSRPILGLALLSVVLAAACGTGGPSADGGVPAVTPSPNPQMSAPTAAAGSGRAEASSGGSPIESMSALSARVVSSTPLDIFPGGPAVGSQALWYWDELTGQVVRLDATDGRSVATISIGDPDQAPYGSPKTVAANGDIVWVTDASSHAVVRIDPVTNKVVDRIALDAVDAVGVTGPVDPFGLVIDGTALWVSDFDQGIVVRVDPSSATVTNVVSGFDHPEGVAVGFGSIWVVEHRTGAIARIDLATATVAARISLPGTGDQAVCGMCVD